MKTIGLLGGTSWPSTILFYQTLNELVQQKLGGDHSAKILLKSIDYHEIKSCYAGGWDKIPMLLKSELEDLAQLKPDCVMICNNTLHKAFDKIESELDLQLPVIHIVDCVGEEAKANHLKTLLLLATKFTMEDGFFHERLKRFGLTIETPSTSERDEIQKIQTQLAKGVITEEFKSYFRELIGNYKSVDGVILGCTEIPLAVQQKDFSIPILDPIFLQCRKAVEFALKV